jgi:quinol monooxygenase YgiN
MIAAIALTWKFRLGQHEVLDFRPSMDWPLPVPVETPERDMSVMVTISYRIQKDKRAEFVAAMQDVREMRRRNGAYFWQLFHDTEDPTRFIECFMDESWVEHLRQHERVSVADRDIQRRAKQYMVEGATTRSQHWLADREP